MKEIRLSRGLSALVDDEDYEMLSIHRWNARIDRNSKTRLLVYAQRSAPKGSSGPSKITMHHAVLGCGGEIDHRDGNGLNNQRSNLRPATHAQNCSNRRKLPGSSSCYKGVYLSWQANYKWGAAIKRNGVQRHLGFFRDEEDAATAYNFAAEELFGDFANFNIPLNVAGPVSGS